MEVGLRVVRGPDWKWTNQDDGEGHVGSVVEVGRAGSTTSPDKTVVVQWDSGSRTNYRVGYQGSYDLRIYDNAPIGIKHHNIVCDNCKKQGVLGMRWKCIKCHDFDLCTLCYFDDKHDTNHPFMRYATPNSPGVKVGKRTGATKIQSKGIFPGAKVVRGPDWDWGNQDGGEGKVGKALDIRGWDNESGRSVVNVTWNSGSTNVYRLGHKGKMDLKYLQDAAGPFYYKDHLPVLGEPSDATLAVAPCHFKVGDKVRVDLDTEILKIMQEGHGGWNPKMADFVGQIGTVHRITERGDIRVQYDGCSNRWTFHGGALTKVPQFNVGDIVQIINQLDKVRSLQPGHGEWTDNMTMALGKNGKVLKVYSDGDLRVNIGEHTWTFNPQCCQLVPTGGQAPDNNDMACTQEREDTSAALNSMIEQFLTVSTRPTDPASNVPSSDVLVRESAQGHLDQVQEIISKYPEKVDEKSSGKTALQVASHQGNLHIVKYLLQKGASLEIRDEDGDSALHYSAFGNQPDVTDVLLQSGATINALNKAGCSTLHVAVNKQHAKCVKILLKYKCDVNIQDSYGDTALHDAIGKDNREIIEMIVAYPQSDFSLKNKRGFNALHHSALKGNKFATENILTKCPQLANTKKDDGFAALHLSALNGHKDVVNALITVEGSDIEIRNNRKQTALLLAVSQGHMHIIDLLLTKGANVKTEDEDGDTCVHLALMRQSVPGEAATSPLLEQIKAGLTSEELKSKPGVAIACYLIQHGASLNHKNRHNKTPLDIVSDARLIESLKKYAGHDLQSKGEPAQQLLHNECLVCNDEIANVTFEPCGHMVTCVDCCKRMKKCVRCQQAIRKKLRPDGSPLYAPAERQQSADSNTEQIKEMERRMQEMEDSVMCGICMDNKKNVAFLCGHSACMKCAQPLKNCHMCRKPITKRINLF